MEPNTILMGWTAKPSHRESFVGLLRAFKQADYNACFLHYRQSRQFGEHEKIDLWWTGKGRNLSLAISLLRYVTASGKWRHAHIRLLVAHAEQLPGMQVQRQLESILDSYRVQMEICLVNNTIERLPLPELIAQESDGSDLTLVGIPDIAYQDGLEEFVRSFQAVLPQMGATLFIHAASSFEEWQLSIPSAQPASAAPVPASPLPLPDLVPFRHFVIQEDLRQADRYGQQLAEAFFLQSTAGLFKALQEMGEESTNWMQQLSQSLLQASQQPEAYRRKKAVDKLRNSSYFRVNALLEKLPMATVGQQLDEAVRWYLGQLDKMVARFPMQVSLSHEAAEIAPSPSDSWAVKRLKWRYRTIALFRGGKVRVQLQYRNAAAWHIGYQQRELLANYLHALFFDGLRLLSAWRDLLAYPENTLETLLPAVLDGTLDPADVQAMQAAWQEKQASFLQELRLQEEIYRMRLLVACRENLNQMGNMLCSPLAKREIARLQAPQERVQWLDGTLATYRELWGKQLVRYANKISLEWAIISLRGRMATLLHGFQEDIGYLVQRRYGKELQQLEQSIRQLAEGGAMHEVRMPDVHLLADAFEKQEQQLEALLESLPERMEVLEATAATDLEDGEAVSIPVARMTAHFLESQLVQPLKQAVEQLASQAAKSLYAAKDQAHLAKFHLDNQELEAGTATAKALKALEQEAEHLAQAQEAFRQKLAQCLHNAFLPLSAGKIVSSAKDFSQYLREYQSKKVLSGAGRLLKLGEELLRRQTAQLLYSQSKGKLLAKRLTEDQAPGLQAGRLLDFSEQYAPSAKVLEQLPNYYASLFSGRSQIDEDFWVPRPEEEALFKKAVKRYRQGMRGAIMLLGPRNAGKSILARTCIDRFYGGKTIQIFPLPEGSPRAQDLAEALRQATGLSGSPDEVLQALPQGTALLVHDLELWWERAPQGWDALELLKKLVNQYAHRCLFVFNTNPSAYQLMRAGLQLDALFIQVISCQPFNASELQQLVMLRHQSSGLGLSLRKKRPGIGFADWRMARAFNQLFNLSGGNPGAALSLWLASIRKVKDQSLHIELPKVPSSQDWKSLDEEHWRWLAQLALHKRMTLPRLQAVLQLPEDTAFELLQGLLRTGLVRERQRGVYMLAEHLDHYLIRILKTRELI
jgi:hypothetical protein